MHLVQHLPNQPAHVMVDRFAQIAVDPAWIAVAAQTLAFRKVPA
jgi:hypothetical protein